MMRIIGLLLLPFAVMSATFNPIATAPVNIYGLPLLSKGALVVSDGVQNGESSVCANGEILEWDSTQATGVKCTTKPSSPTLARATSTGLNWNGTGPSLGLPTTGATFDADPSTAIPEFSIDVTHSGGPLKVVIDVFPTRSGTAGSNLTGSFNESCGVSRNTTGGSFTYASMDFRLNGTRIYGETFFEPFAGNRFFMVRCHLIYELENAAAGTYQLRAFYDAATDASGQARFYPNLQPYIVYVP